MAFINLPVLRKELKKGIASSDLRNVTAKLAKEVFQEEKNQFLENFYSHPVSEEIKEGPLAPNISQTLDGNYGNLFSFIGFAEGSDPIGDLARLLKEGIYLDPKLYALEDWENGVIFKYKVNVLAVSDIEAETPLPWEPGKSWVRGIERGISGLGHYLYRERGTRSRSGTGIQVEGNYRPYVRFNNTRYLSDLLNKFKKKLSE